MTHVLVKPLVTVWLAMTLSVVLTIEHMTTNVEQDVIILLLLVRESVHVRASEHHAFVHLTIALYVVLMAKHMGTNAVLIVQKLTFHVTENVHVIKVKPVSVQWSLDKSVE